MADMVPIKFTKPSLPYLTDETAWFTESQAAAYIKQGFAVRDPAAGKYVPAKTRAEIMAEAQAEADRVAARRRAAAA